MTYLTITPFRRTIDAALLAHQKHAEVHPDAHINKWEILRELATARKVFDLSDRDLGVLRALLSFYPQSELQPGQLVVYPSNVTLSERLNGMPLSTLRRHMAKLVDRGFVIRRDSPNGKRFVRRSSVAVQVFGFDLSPLLSRSTEIIEAAQSTLAAQQHLHQLRQTIVLMRRDLAGLVAYGQASHPNLLCWGSLAALVEDTNRTLRRLPVLTALETMHATLHEALHLVQSAFAEPTMYRPKTEEMSINHAKNEQHHQNSNKDTYESEIVLNQTSQYVDDISDTAENYSDNTKHPSTPLAVVLDLCRDVQIYAQAPIRHWGQFVQTVNQLRPMMGISPDIWEKAKTTLGCEEASVVLAAMLQRFGQIRSPGAYLRHLCRKAEAGAFSSGPMLRALQSETRREFTVVNLS